ncbi:hypothetical protein TNCV_3717451 [Trichonephila clavipes]|nr:hypothetical protein TNCV_3717451 [Trichonephila clavipes]
MSKTGERVSPSFERKFLPRNVIVYFITKIDYRKDGKKVFNFVIKIQNRANTSSTEPLRVGNRVLTNDMDISNSFNSFYSTKQRLKGALRPDRKLLGEKSVILLRLNLMDMRFSIEILVFQS